MKLKATSVLIVLGLVLAACSKMQVAGWQQTATPAALPQELTIEEHALKNAPELDPLTYVPVVGSQEEILRKNAGLRSETPSDPVSATVRSLQIDGDHLEARVTDTEGKVSVQVMRNGNPIYSDQLGDVGPVQNLWGLWTYDGHWVLEVARTRFNSTARPSATDEQIAGDVVVDAKSLNAEHGYGESFGFQLLNGKPFYFFKKAARAGSWNYGISYDGKESELGYTNIPHYNCCSGAALNPKSSKQVAAFFSQRGQTWYYVEILAPGTSPSAPIATTIRPAPLRAALYCC